MVNMHRLGVWLETCLLLGISGAPQLCSATAVSFQSTFLMTSRARAFWQVFDAMVHVYISFSGMSEPLFPA